MRLVVHEITRVGTYYLDNIIQKQHSFQNMRGPQPYHPVGAITGPGMLRFWRLCVRVRFMIMLRNYVHVHVRFVTYLL
jgi:hypothetical protein